VKFDAQLKFINSNYKGKLLIIGTKNKRIKKKVLIDDRCLIASFDAGIKMITPKMQHLDFTNNKGF
jgi:hypothetical protein